MTLTKEARTSLAKWLALAALLSGAGILVALDLYVEHGRTETRERQRLLGQARVIAENLEAQLYSANLTLAGIRDELAVHGHIVVPVGVNNDLKILTQAMPGIRAIGILDAQGRLLASNETRLIGTDLSYRDYFRTVRERPASETLYISRPFKSLLGVYAVNISRAIIGPHGEFAGIVTATLDPDHFRSLMDSVLYAPDMWDSIAHGSGVLFLMWPEHPNVQGMNIAQPGSFFTRHRESGQTITVMTGKVYATGEVRMMAVRTLNPAALRMDIPLVVAVSRDLGAIFQPWREVALVESGLLGLIVLISVFGMHAYLHRQRKLTQQVQQARDLADRFSIALDRMPTYIYMKDRQRRYVYANRPTLELFGCSAQDLVGSPDARFFPPEAVAHLHEIDTRVLEHGEDTAEEVVVQTDDGARRVYWEIKTPIYESGDSTRIWGLCGISTDITERKTMEERLEQQARQDYLTGLCNRRHFMDQGERELARALRYDKALSVFMLDIDHFKQFNDLYGHKAGDAVLQKLADVMRGTLRAVDIIGRMGGEEFAVLLPETDLPHATEVAERLRANVAAAAVVLDGGLARHFTISLGISELRTKEVNLDILLSEADRALYEAKAGGRDRVCTSQRLEAGGASSTN